MKFEMPAAFEMQIEVKLYLQCGNFNKSPVFIIFNFLYTQIIISFFFLNYKICYF